MCGRTEWFSRLAYGTRHSLQDPSGHFTCTPPCIPCSQGKHTTCIKDCRPHAQCSQAVVTPHASHPVIISTLQMSDECTHSLHLHLSASTATYKPNEDRFETGDQNTWRQGSIRFVQCSEAASANACCRRMCADLHGICIPKLHSPQVCIPAEPGCLQVCGIGSHQSIQDRLQSLVLLLDVLQAQDTV